MRALCLLALMILAPGAAPQGGRPAPQPDQTIARPIPFLFQRRARPAPGFDKIKLEAWLEAVSTHRPGEFDDGARAAAALGPDALADIIAAFERTAVPVKDRYKKVDTCRRAAMLHTDVAMVSAQTGYLDEVNEAAEASLHLGVALELLEALKRETAGGPDDPFVTAWWRAIAAVLGEHHEAVSAVAFMRRAAARFPADPDILLMAGAENELVASPMVQDDSEAGLEWRVERGTEAENLRAAEQRYREVLKTDPSRLEARVRLGRVLEKQRRFDAAVRELAAVTDQAVEPRLRFYRDLFIGEAEEGRGRDDAAREAYRRALALYPGAQSAHLALARLERRGGSRAREQDVVVRLLKLSTREDVRQDPWRDYFVATPARHAAEWLEQLRAALRRRP